jgi:hypothetical protein
MRRRATETDGTFALREPAEAYSAVFAAENERSKAGQPAFFWRTKAATEQLDGSDPARRAPPPIGVASYGRASLAWFANF